MKKHCWLLIPLIFIISSGCATIVRGTDDTLKVSTEPPGANVELSSGQTGTTPCSFVLKRNKSFIVKLSKDGYHTETVTVYPTLAGAGVILGGLIDYGTGAVYNLTPNPVYMLLKEKESSEKVPK